MTVGGLAFEKLYGAETAKENMRKITQIKGHPGSGKTLQALNDMINKPDLYVYAGSRKALVDEAREYLETNGFPGWIDMIYADETGSNSKSVENRIEEWIRTHRACSHAVLLITHAGLCDSDQEQYQGYRLIIDEVPQNAVFSDTIHGRISLPILKTLFDLLPDPENRENTMVLKAKAGNVHDILGDPYMANLGNIWKRARRGLVLVECTPRPVEGSPELDPWADIALKHCSVTSVWSFAELSGFDSITVMAAGLERSLVHLCNPIPYGVRAIDRPVSKAQVRIHCLEAQPGSNSTYFASAIGRHNLALFADYLRKRAKKPVPHGDDSSAIPEYWTCNGSIKDFLLPIMPSGYVSPMQEGSNRLRSATSCIAIYSAKKTPSDNLLCRLFNLTADQIKCAREHEHLNQFVMRGAVRDHDFAGTYNVYVEGLDQGERLRAYMNSIGFPDVQVDMLDLEGKRTKPEAAKAGRKAFLTKEETKARKKESNARIYKARKQKDMDALLAAQAAS